MSILSLINRGGGLMWVLLLISVVVIAIVIEKYRYLSKVRKLNQKLANALKQQDKLDNIKSVLRIYKGESPLSVILSKLYLEDSRDIYLVKESMETAAGLEMHKLEKGMGWLSTFSAIAPLIGFLGTVLGMVKVFMNISGSTQSAIDISTLAGGIWVALLTTVGGLVVGIPTLIFYNDLVGNLENIAHEMESQAVTHLKRFQSLT
ncbi:MAG TPA: MotA/TolQ/ExbB proton channel family protein [Candidatus Cloacimonadota bacterium]|nr:MotA/TolQ/ExbB proton channel family protein [Candidatus Cloacimonadota bacterium]HPS37823.1 MotA/TolQ/ExbB proton channel family protein [Candidatus Cloacimonadota bacterium]